MLRHVSMVGLVAAYQPTSGSGQRVGGAVYVSQGTLTVEHALFVGNTAFVSGRQLLPSPCVVYLSRWIGCSLIFFAHPSTQ